MANLLQKVFGKIPYQIITKEKAKAISLVNQSRFYNYGVKDNKPRGITKPGGTSFQTLRRIASYDGLTRICINAIKKSVAQSKWKIKNKEGVDTDNTKAIEYFTDLFTLQNANSENMRLLLDKMVEDLLVLDAGVIEKVYDPEGLVVGLNAVDGATICPVMDSQGNFGDPAYQQKIETKVVAEFKKEELIYIMQNPQNDVYNYGYGKSPIEGIMLAVQASIEADLYNARSFSESNVPPGILDLGDRSDEEAQEFMALWNATVMGDMQKLKFVWGNDKPNKYTEFGKSNKDMQFAEYIDWLSRLKLAAFGLTGLDANIVQDVNRSTAEVQSEISNARGVQSVKRLIEEYLTREVIAQMGFKDIEFEFEKIVSLTERKTQAEVDEIKIRSGVLTADEVREREGYDALGETEPVVTDPKLETKKNRGSYFPPMYP